MVNGLLLMVVYQQITIEGINFYWY